MQVENKFAALQHHAVRLLQSFNKDSPRRLVRRKLSCARVKSEEQALNPLKEGVVQVACYALALREPLFKQTLGVPN